MVNKIMSYQKPIKMNIAKKTASNWMKKVQNLQNAIYVL